VEVRKSKAEEKLNLKRELEDNGKLRLESTRIQNEKLRKEVESAKVPTDADAGKDKKASSPSPKKKETPAEGKTTPATASDAPPAVPAVVDGGDADVEDNDEDELEPHPLQYVADRIDRMSAMFEEELAYKKQKREAKSKAPANSHRAFAVHNNYLRAMDTNNRVMGNSSLF
jgi:hypothetical protein